MKDINLVLNLINFLSKNRINPGPKNILQFFKTSINSRKIKIPIKSTLSPLSKKSRFPRYVVIFKKDLIKIKNQ